MLSVPCATIRTPPLATHGFPTISADEKRSVFRAIPIERKINIGHQQQIAHIVEAQNAKHDVVDSADAHQTASVEDGLGDGQFVENVVDSCHTHDEHRPNRRKEDGQKGRNGERIERGMEIEVPPHVGREQLNAGIKGGRGGHDDGQQGGIKRIDVLEMHQVGMLAHEFAHHVKRKDEHKRYERQQQMHVGEKRDKL